MESTCAASRPAPASAVRAITLGGELGKGPVLARSETTVGSTFTAGRDTAAVCILSPEEACGTPCLEPDDAVAASAAGAFPRAGDCICDAALVGRSGTP